MIENKEIVITKDNQFDKGWTLFHAYEFGINNNRFYKDVIISDIVRKVTHSNEVYLILSEPCLSNRILEEISWANKYIKLSIIARDDSILSKYSKLSFNNKIVDKTIDFNYLGIIGNESGYYMIADGYIEIDDSINNAYFSNSGFKSDYSFLNNARRVIVIDSEGNKDYAELLLNVNKAKIPFNYVVNIDSYNKSIYDLAKNNQYDLLVSDYTNNGVIVIYNDGKISCAQVLKKNLIVPFYIESIYSYLKNCYQCDFYPDVLDTRALSSTVYSCYNGKLNKLNIEDQKIIDIPVAIDLMSDFVDSKFDSSITDRHNDYSAEARSVKYCFSLIPPIIDKSYYESKIYDETICLKSEWDKMQILKFDKIKADYKAYLEEDFGILHFINEAQLFNKEFNRRESECDYTNYYNWIKETIDLYDYIRTNLIDICKKMYSALNIESKGTKFDKFDNEIAGYEQTIKEKNALIEKGIEVLSNKRRVEVLQNKINNLLELKKGFESKVGEDTDKGLLNFLDECNALLSNKHKSINDDSIGSIVKAKELSKLQKLEKFVDDYLFALNNYLNNCLDILNSLSKVHIPESYKVYEKNDARFIVINDLKEYETTKDLCKEFNLKCITRR